MYAKISIIIPTLNEEQYLPRLLDDCVKQTVQPYEVIIVDGKSEDTTKKVALSFKKLLSLEFLESSRRRVAYQRNLGAKNAKGDYLFFVDADSRLGHDVLEKFSNMIEKQHGLLYLPVMKPSKTSLFNKAIFRISIQTVYFMHMIGRPLAFGPFLLIQNNLFKKIGGYEEDIQMGEDHNIIIKAFQMGVKAKFVKDVECIFSMRRLSIDSTGKVFIQYIKAVAVTVLKGRSQAVEESYEMGGQRYRNLPE